MRLNSLQLINFRNYDNLHLNFEKNINLLVGKNGQGKTNIDLRKAEKRILFPASNAGKPV